MTASNKFIDDLSHLMANALGLAQGAKAEAETALRSRIERWLAAYDLVTREEYEALKARVEKLEGAAKTKATPAKPKDPPAKTKSAAKPPLKAKAKPRSR